MQVRVILLFWFIYKHCILRRAWNHQSMFNRKMIYQNQNIKGTRKKMVLLNQTLQNQMHEVESKKDSHTISLFSSQWKESQLPQERGTSKHKDFVMLLSCLLQIITRIILQNFQSVIYPPCIPGTEEPMYSKVEKESLCRCSTNVIK